jgi:glycosyltransferase involved in cell wall biosynthesis
MQMSDGKLRVVLVTSNFPNPAQPDRGEVNVQQAQCLTKAAEVMVLYTRAFLPGRPLMRKEMFKGIPLRTLSIPQMRGLLAPNVILYRWLGWPFVASLLRSVDLVHSIGMWTSIVVSGWAKRAGIHHTGQATGSDVNEILPRLRESRIIRGWETHLHGVACNSKALARAFLNLYPTVPGVRAIYRGVRLDRFQPEGDATGWAAGRPPVRFLFLGGFAPRLSDPRSLNLKGGEMLLDVWRTNEDILYAHRSSLFIAGTASDTPTVHHWRNSLHHTEQVGIGGVIRPEAMPAVLRASDVVLVPSLAEGLPNVVMEAAACGKPSFGSDVGGIPEVIRNGETGVLLPSLDKEAWARALLDYSGRAAALRCMGEKARLLMEAEFNHNKYGHSLVDFYREALSRPLSVT